MNPVDNGVFVWVIKCSPCPSDTVALLHKIGGIKKKGGEEDEKRERKKKSKHHSMEHYLMNKKKQPILIRAWR